MFILCMLWFLFCVAPRESRDLIMQVSPPFDSMRTCMHIHAHTSTPTHTIRRFPQAVKCLQFLPQLIEVCMRYACQPIISISIIISVVIHTGIKFYIPVLFKSHSSASILEHIALPRQCSHMLSLVIISRAATHCHASVNVG